METVKIIPGLSVIAGNYEALLCDAWGVIHNGVRLFPGIEAALLKFRRERGPVIILTNAPRPSDIIPAQLDRIGLSREAYDGIVTSGDAVRAEIIKRLPGPFFRLGPNKDDPLFSGLEIDFVSLEEAKYIICTGLMNDGAETPEDYRDMLVQAAAKGIPMICANPDIVVRWGDRLIYCAGALAAIFEEAGGTVIHGGKPHAPIYDLALRQVLTMKSDLDPSRILAIGDGLITDIKGANNTNIDALYIFGGGGIHDGASDAPAVQKALEKAGGHAIAAMETLIW